MTKVGIIGGSGFAGEELIKLLSLHDSSSIIAISSRELKNTPVSDLFQVTDLNFVDPEDKIFFQCDVVFFATPHGISMQKAKSFLERGIKVIDLSADFRLKNPEVWKKWYNSNHEDLTKRISITNVIGFLNNGAKKTVVIGGHYDHLGHGIMGSLHAAKDSAIHNGADDNASGIALMLDLAKELKRKKFSKHSNYLFIAFSGEEMGLLGSNFFCKNPTIDLETLDYMLNFDMVGRLDESKGLAINGVGTSPNWKRELKKIDQAVSRTIENVILLINFSYFPFT